MVECFSRHTIQLKNHASEGLRTVAKANRKTTFGYYGNRSG